MAYLAIYRKFRPNSFDKLVGQEHIVRILTNQIKQEKVGHAYLFTGTRGTGKTSTARLFAKAVNCLSPVEGSPCGKCNCCLALSQQNAVDIVEIDGASNNGVDEIRELKEKVNYLPSIGSKKVYIIDEVHMLTASAYNALLKTLEEPPAHVIFILCTTEVQKMPQTILSRCMRFDFKLITVQKLCALIEYVLGEISMKFENEAVQVIALAGEGSARDSLSILDRCVAYSEGVLKYSDVLEVLGSTDTTTLLALAKVIFDQDLNGTLLAVDDLVKAGKNIAVLAKDMARLMRDIVVVQRATDNAEKILDLPKNRIEQMQSMSEHFDTTSVLEAMQVFSSLEAQLRQAIDSRVTFEAGCLMLVTKTENRMRELEKRVAMLEKNGVASPRQVTEEQMDRRNFSQGRKVWAEMLKLIRNSNSIVLKSACEDVDSVYVEDDVIFVEIASSKLTMLSQSQYKSQLVDFARSLGLFGITLVEREQKQNSIEEDIRDLIHQIGKDKLKIKKSMKSAK